MNLITPKTHKKKGEDLEKWVQSKKQFSKPSPRQRQDSSSSLDYDEIEEIISSGESDFTKNARDQISRLLARDRYEDSNGIEVSASYKEEKRLKVKKRLVKKLIEEKERIISEGMRER